MESNVGFVDVILILSKISLPKLHKHGYSSYMGRGSRSRSFVAEKLFCMNFTHVASEFRQTSKLYCCGYYGRRLEMSSGYFVAMHNNITLLLKINL
jgi:hypothetical protein